MMNDNDRYEHLTMRDPANDRHNEESERETQDRNEIPIDQLFEFLQKVLEEGAARRLILRDRSSRVLLDVPLGPSALVGAVGFLLMPLWLRIVTVVGVLSSITVEIQREIQDEESEEDSRRRAADVRKQRITIERDEGEVPEDDAVI